jgi:uncharacterized protein (DUF2336 family)
MQSRLNTALEPINAMIGALSPKLRGALVEELVDEIARERPEAESRKARVLDNIVASALREAPMSSRVRASPKLARCVNVLPDSATAIACDVVTVAEAVLVANDMPDTILSEVCSADRQEHMQVIAKRPSVSSTIADKIAHLGEIAAVLALVRNAGARLSSAGFNEIAERHGTDSAIRQSLGQRSDCPDEIVSRMTSGGCATLTGEALAERLLELTAERQLLPAIDLIMQAIGRDQDAGRKIIERDDEKALGAVCHIAGIDAHIYEALIECWRVSAGKPLGDVHKAPVRFRLMRPAEIDRIVSRLPMARARVSSEAVPA